MTREFSQAENEYYIELDSESPNVTVTLVPTSDDVVVEGGLSQNVEALCGDNVKKIKVKDANGLEYTYILHFVRNASSDSHLKNIKVAGKEIEGFSDDSLYYEVVMPYNVDDSINLEGIKKLPGQTILNDGDVEITGSTTIHTITVISEDGKNTSDYNIVLNKQPNTKLKYLEINDQGFSKDFNSDILNYDFTVTSGVVSLNITAIPYDDNAKVVIKGAGYIRDGKSTVTITVSREGVEDTIYIIKVKKGEDLGEQEYDFKYTGGYQTFTAPVTGFYKLEAWGASGGKSRINGRLGGTPGKGGYTSGTIKLTAGDTIYVYVGQQGTNAVVGKDSIASWNGGGSGTWDQRDDESSGGGGGATDFRLVSGSWNDKKSLYSRIMVAGAGRRCVLEL